MFWLCPDRSGQDQIKMGRLKWELSINAKRLWNHNWHQLFRGKSTNYITTYMLTYIGRGMVRKANHGCSARHCDRLGEKEKCRCEEYGFFHVLGARWPSRHFVHGYVIRAANIYSYRMRTDTFFLGRNKGNKCQCVQIARIFELAAVRHSQQEARWWCKWHYRRRRIQMA